jgi:hypothetical protein
MYHNKLVTLLFYPGGLPENNQTIHNWLRDSPNTRFKYIVDIEAFNYKFSVPKVKNLYPGIMTITTVVNPWTKVFRTYKYLLSTKQIRVSINDFVSTLDKSSIAAKNFSDYIDTSKDQVDFILRDEYIEEDFLKVSDYFDSTDIPIVFDKKEYHHKDKFYNQQSIEIIKHLFKNDIDYFGY